MSKVSRKHSFDVTQCQWMTTLHYEVLPAEQRKILPGLSFIFIQLVVTKLCTIGNVCDP